MLCLCTVVGSEEMSYCRIQNRFLAVSLLILSGSFQLSAADAGPIREVFVPGYEDAPQRKASSPFRKYEPLRHKITIKDKDTELFIGGNIRSDMYRVYHPTTLQNDTDDEIDTWRQRIELGFMPKMGKKTYGRTALEAKVLMGGVFFWRTRWTKQYGRYEGPITAQDNVTPPVTMQLKEGWINLHLDTLFETFENRPHQFKIGFFPYYVGRGISLGDWTAGGVSYMGFTRSGVQQQMAEYPPGIVLEGELPYNIKYDIYYSPMVSEDVNQFVQDTRSNRIIVPDKTANSRHIVAGRIKYEVEPSENSRVLFEPYYVYYNSPRQTLQTPGDAPTRFSTVGTMIDGQAGCIKFNCEFAGQFGRQRVKEVGINIGNVNNTKQIAFGQQPDGVTPLAAFGGMVGPGPGVDSVSNISLLSQNSDYDNAFAATAANVSQFYTDYRPGYDLNLKGRMFLLDACYEPENAPVRLSASYAYFSGDRFPHNDPVDKFLAGEEGYTSRDNARLAPVEKRNKDYNGFLPLRDYDYRGLWAKPLIFFNAGVIPRPQNIDIGSLQAENDADTTTNLTSIGGGITWWPMKKREKLTLNANFFWHRENAQHYKWITGLNQPTEINKIVVADGDSVKGWYDLNQPASKSLGFEADLVIDYKVNDNCYTSIRMGAFFPGQLYTDLAGQPNINTNRTNNILVNVGDARAPKAVVATPEVSDTIGAKKIASVSDVAGLGTDVAYGFYIRVAYLF